MPSFWLRCWVLLLLGACQTWLPPVPDAFTELPWSRSAADQAILGARRAIERGQVREGLQQVDAVLAIDPLHVDAQRLRQDTLRDRGRRGLLQCEAEAAVAERGDALSHYLLGRVVMAKDRKWEAFQQAAALAPAAIWPWLGIAHTLRQDDREAAARLYRKLLPAAVHHPLVVLAYASLLRDHGDASEALQQYQQLAADARTRGVGELGMAQSLLRLGLLDDAWRAVLAAVRERPEDPELQGLLQSWLATSGGVERGAELLEVLRESPQRLAAFGQGPGLPLLAGLWLQARQPAAALPLFTPAVLDRRPALQRLHRRLLLAVGDVAGFLQAVRAQVPLLVVGAEPNQLRARWLGLLEGPWMAGEPLAEPGQAVGLLQAMLRVGYIVETEQVAALALLRWPQDAGLLAVREEARQQLTFEAGLRRMVYRGYGQGAAAAGGKDLRAVLDELRQLGQRVFGRDVVGQPVIFRLPLLGEMVDPFSGQLAAHFDRYNRHCILGARSGGVPEALLLTRLSLAELPPQPELPLRGRCHEVIACDREVRSWSTVVGGDLAGVALLHHFLIDYDAVQEWARSIADRRRIAAEDGMALLADPLPAQPGMDPFDVGFRLAVAALVADADLEAAVLDTIRCHERQHLVDSFHFLPIEQNLGRGLWLWLRFGLSPAAIHAEMERRAELASLAVSQHTALVLAHIADFLGDPGTHSPHHQGFQALAQQLCDGLRRAGLPPEATWPSRWHLLDPALVREVAARLLRELY